MNMNDHKSKLLAKIAAKEATVAVIGLGYVGTAKKPEALHRGESYIKHIGYIQKTAESIAAHARPGQLVVLESTTYPGTTREEIVPRLEGTATPHLNAQKEETPLAGRRADDPIASGVIEI